MKILAWNINHRIQPKAIPSATIDVLKGLQPDILVLNEYVDGDGRQAFKRALAEMGFGFISVPKQLPRHNQVLIATREPHDIGDIPAPAYDSHAETNFLHIKLRHQDLEIIGLRAPAYKPTSLVRDYWDSLRKVIDESHHRSVAIIGDVNCDPDKAGTHGAKHLISLRQNGWTIPAPSGPWSFTSTCGTKTSRIDHALISQRLECLSARYHATYDSHRIAGEQTPELPPPLSDHAMLVAEVKSSGK